jgi:hypothetical protein
VDNWNEWRERTDPRRRDSDRDGRPDGREDRDRDGLRNAGEDSTGNDPIDSDSDDDGVEDGDEQAGAFANGVLTIDLAAGGSVSGRVTDATELECESENDAEDRNEAEHEDGDDGPRGSARAAAENPGDEEDYHGDEGDHGDEVDHHGDDSCGPDALRSGARVHEAALRITSAGPAFEKVTLLK